MALKKYSNKVISSIEIFTIHIHLFWTENKALEQNDAFAKSIIINSKYTVSQKRKYKFAIKIYTICIFKININTFIYSNSPFVLRISYSQAIRLFIPQIQRSWISLIINTSNIDFSINSTSRYHPKHLRI